MMHKGMTLYNVIFPIWLLALFPITWIVVIPANFLIDLLVMLGAMKYLKVINKKQIIKKAIFKVWIIGFIADFVGSFFMFLVNLININYNSALGKWWYENLASPVMYNPFDSIYAILWTTICVIISAALIYILNKKWTLKHTGLNQYQKHKISLTLAVFTAPYLFYIPTQWFW